MASRFQSRNPQNTLFAGYKPQSRDQSSDSRRSLDRPTEGHLFDSYPNNASSSRGAPYRSSSPFEKANGHTNGYAPPNGSLFPPSTSSPTKRRSQDGSLLPRYTDSSLETLESQNSEGVSALTNKVRQLKDLTSAIGVEIRDSSALAEKMNEQFEGTSLRLKGTMNRMLRMAERSGIGWRVWLGFFALVGFLFFWVWI